MKAYQEYRDNIFSWAIEIRGLEKSQRTIGLNASRAIVELLSAYARKPKVFGMPESSAFRAFAQEKAC